MNLINFIYWTDPHVDYANGVAWHEYQQEQILHNEIAPYMKEHNLDTIFINGDFFDKRAGINTKSLEFVNRVFLKFIFDNNYKLIINTGNHDVFYKNTNAVNALLYCLPKHENIRIITEPTVIDDYLIIPWITADNQDAIFKSIEDNRGKIKRLFGHLEVAGFKMHKDGIPSKHGLPLSLFDEYEAYSGHYHVESENGNVKYTDNLHQLTKSDMGDDKKYLHFTPDSVKSITVKYKAFVNVRMNVGEVVEPFDAYMKHVYIDVSKGVPIEDVKVLRKKLEETNPVTIVINNENSIEIAREVADNIDKPKSTKDFISDVITDSVFDDVDVDKNVFLEKMVNIYERSLV